MLTNEWLNMFWHIPTLDQYAALWKDWAHVQQLTGGIRRMCCEGRKLRRKAMRVWNEANPKATMSENRAVTSPLLPERAAPEEPCLSLWAKMVTVTRTETWVSRNVLPSASKEGHPAETIGLAIGNYPIWTQLFSTNWDWTSLNYSFTWTDLAEADTETFPT